MATHAGAGRIDWIGLRPVRLEPPVEVEEAQLLKSGLKGDHSRSGQRALTLIQAEHLPVIAAFARLSSTPPPAGIRSGLPTGEPETPRPQLAPGLFRRNLVVSGVNLNALKGVVLRIGEAEIELTVPCHPCSRMEAALGPGGYNAMRGHGGWCARVLTPGRIALGDSVCPA